MRSVPLDIARGLAIVGVVFNHSVDGLLGAGIIDSSSDLAAVNDALHVLRMPTLVLLVGLFIPAGMRRRGARDYVSERLSLLIYLYVLWQLVQGVLELATGSVRNGSTTLTDILSLQRPLAHLWFLPFLALATAIVVFLRAMSTTRTIRVCVVIVLASVTFATWAAPIELAGLRGIALVGFLGLGAAIGLPRMASLLARPLWQWVAAGLVGLAVFLLLLEWGARAATVPAPPDPLANLVSVVAASVGVVILLAVAVVLARVPVLGRTLALVGGSTLAIYLAHIVVVAGGRVLLEAVGITSPGLMLLVLVPVGVIIPMLLNRLAPLMRLGWLFGLPQRVARLVRRRPRHRAYPIAQTPPGEVLAGQQANSLPG